MHLQLIISRQIMQQFCIAVAILMLSVAWGASYAMMLLCCWGVIAHILPTCLQIAFLYNKRAMSLSPKMWLSRFYLAECCKLSLTAILFWGIFLIKSGPAWVIMVAYIISYGLFLWIIKSNDQ
jgi:hypothetical protein